jgi:hypothetical protein
MEFSVAEMFDSQSVIANAYHKGLRLFAVQKNTSVMVDDIPDSQYVVYPTPVSHFPKPTLGTCCYSPDLTWIALSPLALSCFSIGPDVSTLVV